MKVKIKEGKFEDFSSARNISLKMASCDYILVGDADDFFDNPWAILDMPLKVPTADCFKNQIVSYTHRKTTELIFQNRMFKNGKGYFYTNKCHEDVTFSMKEGEAKFANSNLVVHHLGYKDEAFMKVKNKRNLKLLLEDIKDPKAHSLTYFGIVNALMIADGYDNHVEAMLYVDKCFAKCDLKDTDPLTPKMWVLRGLCCMYCKQFEAAEQSFKKALSISEHPEASVNLAEIYMMRNEWNKTIELLTKLYEKGVVKIANIPFDVDRIKKIMVGRLGRCHDLRIDEIKGLMKTMGKKMEDETEEQYKAKNDTLNHNLKESYRLAEKYYTETLALDPAQKDIADRLVFILHAIGNHNHANFVTVNMVNMFPDYAIGWLNLAMFEVTNKRYHTALVFLREAIRIDPKNPDIRHNLKNVELALRGGKGRK